MHRLEFTKEARHEYADSLEWYAERSPSAAGGFEAEFERVLDAIAMSPDLYPHLDGRHRSCLLKDYPYRVVYRAKGSDTLVVVAVAHTSRRPGYWRSR